MLSRRRCKSFLYNGSTTLPRRPIGVGGLHGPATHTHESGHGMILLTGFKYFLIILATLDLSSVSMPQSELEPSELVEQSELVERSAFVEQSELDCNCESELEAELKSELESELELDSLVHELVLSHSVDDNDLHLFRL